MQRPWDGLIPQEDEEAFVAEKGKEYQPMDVGERPALIIVDMTRLFVDSAYPSGWSPTGYPAAAANRRLLDAGREAGIPIFFTKSRAESALPETDAEKGRWKQRTKDGSANGDLPPGDVIIDELGPVDGEVLIYKGGNVSGFFGTPLASLLAFHNVDTVIITGMATSGCVRATVVDAFQHNFRVIIPYQACADRSQISHKISLFDMHMQFADVVELDEVLEYLNTLKANQSTGN